MATNTDFFDYLADHLLILIISSLPFKDAARTTTLSKRWHDLWRSTKIVEFKESFFTRQSHASDEDNETSRLRFIDFMSHWIQNFRGVELDNFHISFLNPENFLEHIALAIRFATSHQVRKLEIDFSDPCWDSEDVHHLQTHVSSFDLPIFVYQLGFLESLKLSFCNVQALEFTNLRALKHLSLAYIDLSSSSLKSLISHLPSLENLSLKRCQKKEAIDIYSMSLQTLVIDKCTNFYDNWIAITAPNLHFFKYCGTALTFHFERMSSLQEADFDFALENEYAEMGDCLYFLLHDLDRVKFLTVCSYFLQIIFSGIEPMGLRYPLVVQHLTLKTALHANEFHGIAYMLNICHLLEILSIDLIPAMIFSDYEPPFPLTPYRFWIEEIDYQCLTTTLKRIEIKGFRGRPNEFQLLRYLLKHGVLLETLKIDVSREGDMETYVQNAQNLLNFEKASSCLEISIS
ncbi:FBD domain [Dillenia turbinata]|uniref:FBD domain n=1 Tax=Dillenia turbinata TaxID=194707 RepID=A0AAN8UF48_9MAGN